MSLVTRTESERYCKTASSAWYLCREETKIELRLFTEEQSASNRPNYFYLSKICALPFVIYLRGTLLSLVGETVQHR
jgi:hypothetical protein